MSDMPFDARSPGEILRTAREGQGLHIAALAAAIKVAPRKLDALEHDRWDELPDATFVRALAQTVCRTLKIDPVPVLALLPPAGGIKLEPVRGGLNAPFHDRPGRDEPGLALGAIRPMAVAASVLMLAAVALVLVPDSYWAGSIFRSAPAPAAAASAASASAPTAATAAQAASAASAAVADMAASGAAAAAGLFPPSDAVPAMAAVTAVAADRPASTGASLLLVRTTGVSWVQALDASGRVLVSRMVQAGEQLDLDGRAPIRLTVGNAAATRLVFRGQPFDLLPSTRDNVARVELK